MRSRAFLTVAAVVSATVTSGVAGAGTAEADTTPAPSPAHSDPLHLFDNVCLVPLRLEGPLATNALPNPYRACSHNSVGGDGKMHVLDNLCVAPVQLGIFGDGPKPYAACNDEVANGGKSLIGPISALRNLSILGAQVTH